MLVLFAILVPLVALLIWAVMFDLKRKRHADLTSHDIVSAARTARGNADARGGGPGGSDGGRGNFNRASAWPQALASIGQPGPHFHD